jgi:hypothetical protein
MALVADYLLKPTERRAQAAWGARRIAAGARRGFGRGIAYQLSQLSHARRKGAVPPEPPKGAARPPALVARSFAPRRTPMRGAIVPRTNKAPRQGFSMDAVLHVAPQRSA